MKLFQWVEGRQNATKTLKKFLICYGKRWDCYLIKMPKFTFIDWHFDKVDGKSHKRINITLKGSWFFEWKSSFIRKKGAVLQKFLSWHIFRPDVEEHCAITTKDTIILSIGWVNKH